MILIISQSQDGSTDHVIEWLLYYTHPFARLNGVDFFRSVHIKIANDECSLHANDIDWSAVSVIWYRRWISPEEAVQIYVQTKEKTDVSLALGINEFIRTENKSLVSFFFNSLPKKKVFEPPPIEEINKLMVLKMAVLLGIDIPCTHVISSRQDFNFMEQGPLVTKAISNIPNISYGQSNFAGYTTRVVELPYELGKQFAPSLFQSMIKKKYEIRAFLLSGKFYSMAIFSQTDPQTSVDFRKYNFVRPNRTIPFKLPDELEQKLLKLATYFDLRTGSFDIIKTTDNKYVFLEINPGGQFGMVSYPCNYYLEKLIALELMNFQTNEV